MQSLSARYAQRCVRNVTAVLSVPRAMSIENLFCKSSGTFSDSTAEKCSQIFVSELQRRTYEQAHQL